MVFDFPDPLCRRIQEQGLRTYLFTYAPHYTTLSLSLLSRTFSLPLRTVTSIVSKMIWSEELSASLDQAQGVVVFHRIEFSRAQQLAQTVADKVAAMVEQNEKALDAKMGVTTGWGDRQGADKGEKRGEQTQERRGRGDRTRGARGMFTSCRPLICSPFVQVECGGVDHDLLRAWVLLNERDSLAPSHMYCIALFPCFESKTLICPSSLSSYAKAEHITSYMCSVIPNVLNDRVTAVIYFFQ